MSCPEHQLIANESAWVMKNIDIYKLFCGDQWEAKRSKVPNYIYISGKNDEKKLFFPLLPLKQTHLYISY